VTQRPSAGKSVVGEDSARGCIVGAESSRQAVVMVEHERGNELFFAQFCAAQDGMEPNGTRDDSVMIVAVEDTPDTGNQSGPFIIGARLKR
jgi:hypothetical protein